MCTSSGARPRFASAAWYVGLRAHRLAAGNELLGMDGGLHVRHDAEAREPAGVDVDARLERPAGAGRVEQDGARHPRRPLPALAPGGERGLRRPPRATSTKRTSPTSGDSRRIATAAEILLGRERV